MTKLYSIMCLITFAILVIDTAKAATTTTTSKLDNRGRYNPYQNDAFYNNRYYKNRDYYNNRQNYFRNFNSGVAAPQARIIEQDFQANHDGAYAYKYNTENGIYGEERGYGVNVGTDDQKEVVEGSYAYISPEGIRISVRYTADENGYHPIITYDGANAAELAISQQPADVVINKIP